MKRIGIAQIWQESNCFNPVLSTLNEFEFFGIGIGSEVISKYGNVGEIEGFLEGLGDWSESVEPVGLLRAQAWPGGPLSKDARLWFLNALEEQLKQAGPLDGILLSLHGSLMGEDEIDVDGCILEMVRKIVGPEMAVVATVDCHCYCTDRMLEFSSALVAYHTNPHIDIRQTGFRGANVLKQLLGGANPAHSTVRLPMISPGEAQDTSGEALGPIFRYLKEIEDLDEVISAGVLMTQPWMDVPNLGWSTFVTTDQQSELGDKLAKKLAEMCWDIREKMIVEFQSGADSVAKALRCTGKPVIIADGADATNSGAGGDSIHLLKEMIKHNIPDGALTIMVDPEAVAHAKSVGTGGVFEFAVGGKRDNIFSQPFMVKGKVQSLQKARYVLRSHLGNNLDIDSGDCAIVRIEDVTVLLVSRPGPGSTPLMYRCVGLEPKDFKIVIVKSPAGFRAEFAPFAAEIILSDCPGCASPHFGILPYTRVNRPLWPLDDIEDWHNVDWI